MPAPRELGSARISKFSTEVAKNKFDHKGEISHRQGTKKYKSSQAIVNYVFQKSNFSYSNNKITPWKNKTQQLKLKTMYGFFFPKKFKTILDSQR